MTIRSIGRDDYTKLKEIHEKFYKEEFSLPDFVRNFLLGFVVEKNDKIVVVGGIRTIAEVVLVTDKDASVRVRRESLIEALRVCILTAGANDYGEIHAFVQAESWQKQLEKFGFNPTKGNALVLQI